MVQRNVEIKVNVTGEESIAKLDQETIELANDTKKAEKALIDFTQTQKNLNRTVDKSGLIYSKNGKIIVDATNKYRNLDNQVKETASSLKTSLNPATKAVKKGLNDTGKALGGVGRNAGQAGIQIQQFVGQVQGGQSAMVALSQQSADLGFVLGAPLVGAIVGIGTSLIGMALAFGQANIEMEKSSDVIDELIGDFDKLDEKQKIIAKDILSAELAKQTKAIKDTKTALNDYERSLNVFTSIEERGAKIDDYNATILKQELAVSKLKKSLDDINNSGVYQSLSDQMQRVTDDENERVASIADLIVSTTTLSNEYGKSTRELALMQAEQLNANDLEKQAINIAFDKIDAINAETQAIKDKALALSEENKLKQQFNTLEFSSLGGEEKLEVKLANDLALADEFALLGIEQEKRALEVKTNLMRKYYDDLKAFRTSNALEEHISSAKTINTFVSSLQQLNTKSDGLKRASIISSTAVAVMETYARVPPPWGIPLALITAGVGLKQLAQVGKKSGGISASAGSATASAGLTQPTFTQDTQVNNIQSTELLALRNELASLDPDEVLPVAFTRRLALSLGSATNEGTI